MFNTIKRRLRQEYTQNELYDLWENTFFQKRLQNINPKKEYYLEIENMFLRKENKRLYSKFILSS